MICEVSGIQDGTSVNDEMKAGEEFWCENTRGHSVFNI